MHRLTLGAALAALIACAPKVSEITGAYRATDVPIYSSATLNETRLIGPWAEVGAFGGTGCRRGSVAFAGGPGTLSMTYDLCLSGAQISGGGAMQPLGPGRYRVPGLADDLWLLWIDTDARTLVFGTPSGSFGFVLNRGGDLPADRARALREILDWNGYDTAALTLW